MRVYDISVGISSSLPVWPGDPRVALERVNRLEAGDESNVTHVAFSAHSGTHVDAPLHFFQDGIPIDQLDLKALMGRVYVVALPKARVLDREALDQAGIPPRTKRVLFKTHNSSYWSQHKEQFQTQYVALDASGAQWLVDKGVQLVGIDYLSIAAFDETAEPHRILLGAGIVVVEGLDLSAVEQGRYTLYCLPLKLLGADGAPARAVLVGV